MVYATVGTPFMESYSTYQNLYVLCSLLSLSLWIQLVYRFKFFILLHFLVLALRLSVFHCCWIE